MRRDSKKLCAMAVSAVRFANSGLKFGQMVSAAAAQVESRKSLLRLDG
jgi:hypothetical protein